MHLEDGAKKWLYLAIGSSLASVVVCIFVVAVWKKLTLMVQLLRETGNALSSMMGLICIPLLVRWTLSFLDSNFKAHHLADGSHHTYHAWFECLFWIADRKFRICYHSRTQRSLREKHHGFNLKWVQHFGTFVVLSLPVWLPAHGHCRSGYPVVLYQGKGSAQKCRRKEYNDAVAVPPWHSSLGVAPDGDRSVYSMAVQDSMGKLIILIP